MFVFELFPYRTELEYIEMTSLWTVTIQSDLVLKKLRLANSYQSKM